MQTRRTFCADVCKAALLGGAIGTMPACGGSSGSSSGPSGTTGAPLTRVTGTLGAGVLTVNVDANPVLGSTGGMALVVAGATNLLVTRTGASTFTALTATCTHEACTIDGSNSGRFVCPCHGSTFDTGGRVITGPAVTALRTFATAFAGSTLTITL
jgi:Rieske Fe-S protein